MASVKCVLFKSLIFNSFKSFIDKHKLYSVDRKQKNVLREISHVTVIDVFVRSESERGRGEFSHARIFKNRSTMRTWGLMLNHRQYK